METRKKTTSSAHTTQIRFRTKMNTFCRMRLYLSSKLKRLTTQKKKPVAENTSYTITSFSVFGRFSVHG